MALYSSVEKSGEAYTVKLANRIIEIKDDLPYLEFFAAKKSVGAFMADCNVWGEDLTQYKGFYDAVISNVEKIKKGICLI